MRPRIAICNEIFGARPLPVVFSLVKSIGYDGIEIAPYTLGDKPDQIPTSVLDAIGRTAARHHLHIAGLHWLLARTEGLHWTSRDAHVRRNTATYLGRLARLCADLGGNVMVLGSPQQRRLGPGVSPEQGADWAADVVEHLLPQLELVQVMLAIEPLGPKETNFLNTAAEVRAFIRRFESRWIGVNLDVKAMASEEEPMPSIIEATAPLLRHFHANDPNRKGPGMGDAAFEPVLRALADVHYHGWISVEPLDLADGAEKTARDSLQYLTSICAKVW
jgi:sugar phosphate isomerase/epimerase